MTREFSGDEPQRSPRRRLGTLIARRTKHLYLVNFDRGAEWAYYPGDDLLDLGIKKDAIFDPVADQWWIRPFPGGYFVFSYSNADGSGSQYKVLPVNASGYGALRDGPLVDDFNAALDVAPNGSFMVATFGSDVSYVGLFLWNGTTFADTPIDTVQPGVPFNGVQHVRISPDSSTVLIGLNGSPFVAAYPVSTSGFGTVYADPAVLPDAANLGVDWHLSGEAVAVSWSNAAVMSTAAWAWSAGWGAKYADPADSFAGLSGHPRFAPDGATLYVHRVSPGDSADGQYRLYNFTLVDGMTTRVAASASPITSPVATNQPAYSGRLIAPGSKSGVGLITYTFLDGVIGPSVSHPEYLDDGFIWRPLFTCFSRDGKFLLGINGGGASAGDGIVRLFAVADDGTLTQLGETFADPFEIGWYKIAWRDG